MSASLTDTYIEVDGVVVTDIDRYVLRFVPDKTVIAVLYYNGRRVVKPWKMRLEVSCPADPHGENANTA